MAFRKRNIAVRQPSLEPSTGSSTPLPALPLVTGVRPSPLTSQPTTSTGTPSLDALLGGHAGLLLGSSLLVEESGTTDFAGALLRYYAAEGICQGHMLHVVGVGDHWARELPGLADKQHEDKHEQVLEESKADAEAARQRMKIAWRYERSGGSRQRDPTSLSPSSTATAAASSVFCHTFDLTKRSTLPKDNLLDCIPIPTTTRDSPFDAVVAKIEDSISKASPEMIHRIVLPTVLSPALYPSSASKPEHFLRFLHTLRALVYRHSDRVTAMLTFPLELHPRHIAITRWAEHLCDGALELTPFPHIMDAASALAESGGARAGEEQPQGLVKVLQLPGVTERGEGGAGPNNSLGEDLAFTLSRRKFVIKQFSLPPLSNE